MAGVLAVFCLLFISLIAQSQGGQQRTSQIKGKTKKVTPVPNGTVDAGPVDFRKDSDGDGMPDEDEDRNGSDPDNPSDADGDRDGDGLSNGDEVGMGSNPNASDSDGDGVSDEEEVRLGYDPLDPNSRPPTGATLVGITLTPARIGLPINTLLGQQPVPLTLTGSMSDGTTVNLTRAAGTTLQSQDESVAVVDGIGSLVGVSPGATRVVASNGNFAAEASVIVSSFTPRAMGGIFIPGFAHNVDVAGNYAYIAAGSFGLRIIDITVRTLPSYVSELDTPGTAQDIRVVGNTVYIADGEAGLQIIDVTDPLNPTLIGSLDTDGQAFDLRVSGTRAYIADGVGGLKIVDVSDSAAPALLGTLATSNTIIDVDIAGDLVAVVEGSGNPLLMLVDVSAPASPQVVGSVATGYPRALYVQGDAAYVAAVGGVHIIDISTPTNPIFASSVPSNGPNGFFAADLAGFGNHLLASEDRYVSTTPIMDVEDTYAPVLRDLMNFSAQGDYYGVGIAVDSQYAYQTGELFFGNQRSGFTILYVNQYNSANDTAGIAPTAWFTRPVNGDEVMEGDDLFINAAASDDVEVASLKFVINGVEVSEGQGATHFFAYRVPVGSPTLTVSAIATDKAGNVGSSAPVTVNVLLDPPPTVDIVEPTEGTQLTEGQTIQLIAEANDNEYITNLVFTVNGVELPANFSPQYTRTFMVPSGVTTLVVEATATDNIGKTTTATRTFAVIPDVGTTVIGLVRDDTSQPIAGANVKVFETFTTQTGADGTFSLANVPTVRGNIVANVTATLNGQTANIFSSPKVPVPEGVTDLGTITLSFGPTAPTAIGVADYDGDFTTDVFIGYPDRTSSIYTYQGGQFAPSLSTVLPFGPVKAGDAVELNFGSTHRIFAQAVNQPGQVIDLSFDTSGALTNASLDTGLDGESDYVAAGIDTGFFGGGGPASAVQGKSLVGNSFSSTNLVLAFLSNTGASGTQLTARFDYSQPTSDMREGRAARARSQNAASNFTAPFVLSVDPSVPLRSLKLADVTGDGLVDLLVIKQVAGSDALLLVYPRLSETSFGAPIESPIVTRSATPARGVNELSIGSSGGGGYATHIYILGDDRVRLYKNNGTGAFVADGEIVMPAGRIPTGIADSDLNGDHRTDILVTVKTSSSPETKSLRVYLRSFDGNFQTPTSKPYAAPSSSGDTRIAIGEWGGDSTRLDAVIVDGESVRLILDVGPFHSSS
jgi:hypothetical protein